MQQPWWSGFVLVVLCTWSVALPAQPNLYLQLQNQLQAVEESNDPDAMELQKVYEKTLQYLEQMEQFKQSAAATEQGIEQYPQRAEQLRQELDTKAAQPLPDVTSWSLLKLQQALSETLTRQIQLADEQSVLQQEINQFNERLRLFGELFAQIRERQKTVQLRLGQLMLETESDDLQTARLVMYEQEAEALQAQLKSLELEQLFSSSQQELYSQQLSLLRARISYQTRLQARIQKQMEQLRLATLPVEEDSEEIGEDVHPLLAMSQARIQQLSQRMDEILAQTDQTRQLELEARTQINRFQQMYSDFQEQIAWLRSSRAYGQTLRRKFDELPPEPSLKELEQAILKSRVERLDYAQELEELGEFAVDDSLPEADLETFQQRLVEMARLLQDLMLALDRLALEQVKLKVSQEQMSAELRKLREMGSQQLFWIPDVPPLGVESVAILVTDLHALVSQQPLRQFQLAMREWGAWVLVAGGLLAVSMFYFARSGRAAFRRYLDYTGNRIGKVTQDKYRYTLFVLLLSILLTLPVLAIWSALALLLIGSWRFPLVSSMGYSLLDVLLTLIFFMVFWNLARPKGLLIAHLGFAAEPTRQMVKLTRILFLLVIPLLLIIQFTTHYREIALERSVGRLALMLSCLIQAWLFLAVLRDVRFQRLLPGIRGANMLLRIVVLPLFMLGLLAVAVAAGLGYFTVAASVNYEMFITLRLALLFTLLYFLVHRFMLVQERRLAFEQAKARRAKMLEKRAKEQVDEELVVSETLEGLDEPEIDLDTISSQSLGLLRAVLMLGFLMVLPFVWAAGALAYLETVEIWQTSTQVGGVEQLEAVTLGDILLGLFVLLLIMVVVKNLAGAMELLFLQHLDLAPGTGFAITTISRYLVIVIGVFYVAGFVGIDWSRAQWLVAALTVGLGFGLQEIFANFVSGLILLFEKPIRLGDTITIREITGSVTRIQTRATTIVDWDRKEIIVPNKTFITEDFINWSLTDPITRVIMYVELPRETDTAMATEVLLDTAQNCNRVLDTPPPEVYFNAFSNGNLRFEIRVFLADIAYRQPMAHEFHSRMVKEFRERGVEVAPPQMAIALQGEIIRSHRPS